MYLFRSIFSFFKYQHQKVSNINDVSISGWCIEFGAWDGIYCSNTFNLVKNHDFSAVYIEGSKKKFKKLLKTANKHKNIIPINKYVEVCGKNSLDSILQDTGISDNIDILSIDIDGYDFDVWKGLKKYNPKIVLMEINNTIDPYKRVVGTGKGKNIKVVLNTLLKCKRKRLHAFI